MSGGGFYAAVAFDPNSRRGGVVFSDSTLTLPKHPAFS
jgi:hypothetical protein